MQKVNELEAPADVPEQLLQKLEKDVQVSEEETKKLKRIILYAGLVIALIISLTITCIVAAAIGKSRNRVQAPAASAAGSRNQCSGSSAKEISRCGTICKHFRGITSGTVRI